MNWPREPEAVAMPKAQERFSGGTMRPRAAMTMPKEDMATPMPMRMPAPKWNMSGASATAITTVPMA